jgi:hypothetical protein
VYHKFTAPMWRYIRVALVDDMYSITIPANLEDTSINIVSYSHDDLLSGIEDVDDENELMYTITEILLDLYYRYFYCD